MQVSFSQNTWENTRLVRYLNVNFIIDTIVGQF
jgi:hypothetical protein